MRGLQNLLAKLWADDVGAVIASEYLMLGSIVSLGSVAGLSAMRDAANQEMDEFGQTVRTVNRTYRENLQRQMRIPQNHRSRSYSPGYLPGYTADPQHDDIRYQSP